MTTGNKKGGISNWPASERPRETLLSKGPTSLSNADLIAILIRSGTKNDDAVSLARKLLKKFGGLGPLLHAPRSELEKITGLGPAKISVIMAAQEIARRKADESLTNKNYLNSAEEVFEHLRASMKGLNREVFKVIYLNNSNCVLAVEDVFEGTVDQSTVYPREVIKRALELQAVKLIFAHNHPSGNPNPTQNDIELTRRLFRACESVDLKPLDHIIITDDTHRSVKDFL